MICYLCDKEAVFELEGLVVSGAGRFDLVVEYACVEHAVRDGWKARHVDRRKLSFMLKELEDG